MSFLSVQCYDMVFGRLRQGRPISIENIQFVLLEPSFQGAGRDDVDRLEQPRLHHVVLRSTCVTPTVSHEATVREHSDLL